MNFEEWRPDPRRAERNIPVSNDHVYLDGK
jgi:hypothetical protein